MSKEDIFLMELSEQALDEVTADVWGKVWAMSDLIPLYINYIFNKQKEYDLDNERPCGPH